MTEAERDQKIQAALVSIAEGKSVRKSCEEAGISKTWFLESVSADQYARAREAQADTHFDAMSDLEADCERGTLDPQAFRAIIDSRKWRLARMRPQIYGDTSKIDLTSSDGSMTPAKVVDLGQRTVDELISLARETFGKE